MKKEDRKKLETEMLSTVTGLLHARHEKATQKIRKFLKQHSKNIAKKFLKYLEKEDRKIEAKKKEVAKKKKAPVKKAAVARKK
ncbi:MAG: hypothetical protein IPO39_05740 [Bacteroidetes bacterium]|nr:hypothetical protein [Bacteroidota bacterium]MBK9524250.1 hypothetical protein [Bacteroidota bacterium]MBK9541987.1 hypothetical protein [Bacteroidota bacterium]MBP6650222.1 hypothetical protein [Bacteroidia bacterium]